MEPGIDTHVSLHKLEVFCSIVDHGGFRMASQALHISQPVVSSHVRWLEEWLGVQLFQRDGRRKRLTETGTLVYHWATDVLARTQMMKTELDGLRNGEVGTVLLATSMSVGS